MPPEIAAKLAWMSSPVLMYGLPVAIVILFLVLVVTKGWRGFRYFIGIAAVLGIVGFTGFNAYMKFIFKDFQWQMPPGTVQVQPVAEMTFEDKIEAIGTAQANESTALTSNVSETVKAINFDEGQFVTKGTVIAQLHNDEEQANLAEARKIYNRTAELVRSAALSVARLDQDRARLDVAQAQVNDRTIVAPFDGILGLRSLSVGDIVNPGTVITTLDDVDPIKLEFSIPETFLSAIQTGMKIHAKSAAWPGIAFDGEILAINPRIDPVTRALMVKATIPNPDGKLRAGMLMGVDIIKNSRRALAVSEEALVSQGANKMVMIAGTPDKDGIADVEARPITIGTRQPGFVEVLTGLKPHEKVIVDGVIKAHPGAKVHIVGEKTIPNTVNRAIDNAVPGKQAELQDLKTDDPTPAIVDVKEPDAVVPNPAPEPAAPVQTQE
jgi:membrane fusion protein, multidrug efflux system